LIVPFHIFRIFQHQPSYPCNICRVMGVSSSIYASFTYSHCFRRGSRA